MEKRELVYYRLDKIDGKILDILQEMQEHL